MDKDDNSIEVFEAVHETVSSIFGESVPFLLLLPKDQQIATNIGPEGLAPLLANVLSSMLNGGAMVREHFTDEEPTKGMN